MSTSLRKKLRGEEARPPTARQQPLARARKEGCARKGNQNWKGSKKNQYNVRGAVVTGVHRHIQIARVRHRPVTNCLATRPRN